MLRTLAVIVGFSSLAAADEPRTYPLWSKGVATDPGDENHAGDVPTITVYLPPKGKATGASIIICPGGGYEFLATEHEGKEVAEWLNNAKDTGQNLLGRNATRAELAELSTETKVTKTTPPAFLAHTLADVNVPIENSLAFAAALRKNEVTFELHIFEKGGHGLGLGHGSKQFKLAGEPTFEAWPPLCATWLKSRGFLEKRVR